MSALEFLVKPDVYQGCVKVDYIFNARRIMMFPRAPRRQAYDRVHRIDELGA
jgi:hypothetical protein